MVLALKSEGQIFSPKLMLIFYLLNALIINQWQRIKLLTIIFILGFFWFCTIFRFFRAFFSPFILSPLRIVRATTCSAIPHGALPLESGPPFFSCCAIVSLKKANPRGQAWTWIALHFRFPFAQSPLKSVLWFPSCLRNSYLCLLSCFHFPSGRKCYSPQDSWEKMRSIVQLAAVRSKPWSVPSK